MTKTRTYTGPADLKLLQDFNASAIALTDHCGYLHPGDIAHHLYCGSKGLDLTELLTIWEDDQGIAAWLLLGPRFKSNDTQIRPDLRGSDLEREMLAYGEKRLVELMHKYEIEGDHIYADAFRGETTRRDLLLSMGWQPDNEPPYMLNRIVLNDIEVPALPDGYTFGSVKGIEDAPALAAVHNSAFGNVWTPEQYRNLMQSPGYAPERELVIRAPEGHFVAFCIIWFDHLNRTGLFEPVGTHKEYHRRGFGRAIVMYGMQQMLAAGMEYASVAHYWHKTAARGLYHACGFTPWYAMEGFVKPFK